MILSLNKIFRYQLSHLYSTYGIDEKQITGAGIFAFMHMPSYHHHRFQVCTGYVQIFVGGGALLLFDFALSL